MLDVTEAPADALSRARSPTRDQILEVLNTCYDMCCRERKISVIDMGLIHDVKVDSGMARIEMILTTGWCPFSVHMLTEIEERIKAIEGVDGAEVQIVWNPVWSPDRMSESARSKLTMPIPIELRRGRDAG